jgi:hypothetical protein
MAAGLFLHFRRWPVTFHPAGWQVFATFAAYFQTSIYMQQQDPQQEQQINIELTEEMADGIYANLAIVTHSFAEFVIDFVNVMPNVPKAKVKSRIVMTPQHAKRMMRALIDNVKRFETANGVIKDQETVAMPFTFGGTTGEA